MLIPELYFGNQPEPGEPTAYLHHFSFTLQAWLLHCYPVFFRVRRQCCYRQRRSAAKMGAL